MRRPALYSRSTPAVTTPPSEDASPQAETEAVAGSASAAEASATASPHVGASRRRRWVMPLAVALLMGASALGSYHFLPRPAGRTLTQKDIDAAVLRTLQTTTLPSAAARAADIIRPSVVEVTALGPEEEDPTVKPDKKARPADKRPPKQRTAKAPKEPQATEPKAPKSSEDVAKAPEDAPEVERGVGTGVVIVDKGVILTNLHVVAGAQKIRVTFADGLESPASIVGLQPENDLAVLQAQKIPDDLVAATMRSTADLRPGDNVAVVGFPFGIGPSVSSGVVSGLKRSFRSPEGKQELSNLIQFDAAANPGNSGGPLVNMDGEVLGIVTAILNPTQQRTFVGIGFAVPIENAATAAGTPPF
ncbi:trypsin-like peptidase domain-containing protein [Variovorax dokdonensis]|uniref:Trypsin-like peptidase domain-containing protein n=1 Tax=Variovorax dokdonensis TaxID=344883 RepID=A0ABT7N656_9BURK|nr:trypsin-like peptidase domain-containing protein [Variovorax dokdonensis]MDM0043429.1 trypsin-like peptidase domain-containing protein [Variovorax dokdonensis]